VAWDLSTDPTFAEHLAPINRFGPRRIVPFSLEKRSPSADPWCRANHSRSETVKGRCSGGADRPLKQYGRDDLGRATANG
jgi:hypothetical protein